MRQRQKCNIEGCNNLQMYNKNGTYRLICNKHHREKYGISKGNWTQRLKEQIDNNKKCSNCGWEGPCDRHRIVMGKHGGDYTQDNVMILCPNCHRLLHLQEGSLRVNYKP